MPLLDVGDPEGIEAFTSQANVFPERTYSARRSGRSNVVKLGEYRDALEEEGCADLALIWKKIPIPKKEDGEVHP